MIDTANISNTTPHRPAKKTSPAVKRNCSQKSFRAVIHTGITKNQSPTDKIKMAGLKRAVDAKDERNGKRTKVKGGDVPPQKTKAAAPVKKVVSKPDSKKKDPAKSGKTDKTNGKNKKKVEESEEEDEDEFDIDDLSDSEGEKDEGDDIDMGGLSDEGGDDNEDEEEEDSEDEEEEKKPKAGAQSNGKTLEPEKSMPASHPKVWIHG